MIIHFSITEETGWENMRNIGRIYKKDLKNITTNWVVMILIGGLIILPSLYAWFNIKASWDPYGQTENIPIGVVNLDKGAELRGKDIKGGEEIIKALKKNKSMGWRFVDYDTAMDKVHYGDYFAVIVIPKDFSKHLASVLDEKPQKATIDYYVNEKINAISPKITSKGATVIVDQVSSKFIGTVNGVIFDVFNSLGVELQKDLPDIKRFENYIFKIEKDLPSIHQMLSDSLDDATNAENLVRQAQGDIPKAKQTVQNGKEIIDDTTKFLDQAENRLNNLSPQIKKDLKTAREVSSKANKFLADVQNTNIDFSQGRKLADQLNQDANAATDRIAAIQQKISQLQAQADKMMEDSANGSQEGESGEGTQDHAKLQEQIKQQKQTLQDAQERLGTIQASIQEMQANAANVKAFADDKKKEVDSTISQLKQMTANTTAEIDSFAKEYEDNIEPAVLAQVAKTKETLGSARSLLTDVESTIPQVEQILSSTAQNLGAGQDKLESVMGEYPYVSEKIRELADRIRKIQGETDLGEIIRLLQNDPNAESGFFEEPVKLSENKLFPIANYGTGMTPFYSTLAIWVGCLLLISLVVADVRHDWKFNKVEEYFGRMLTFLTVGVFQTIVITLGDLFILNVPIHNPVWFVLFGILISLVFMLIVYTLVSVFGDVGKALAIILLVLQIAGSGGTYPVVLLPTFFQKIHPFLPFTYGVDLMREAVGGIVWERALHDMMMLGIFALLAIVLGVLLKEPINKNTEKLMKKTKESGLFH